MSIIGAEDLARFGSKECIGALDILALYWKSRRDPTESIGAGVEADLCDRRDDHGANAHATRSHFDAVNGCI